LVFEKRLLYRIELATLAKAFDRRDFSAFDVTRKREAGADGLAFDEHRAGAADTDAAAFDGAFELQIIAQEFQKRLVRLDGYLLAPAVDRC
jgi:hypothetical protein